MTIELCDGCGAYVDPSVCWCGATHDQHGLSENHGFVPMGCECHRDRARTGQSLPDFPGDGPDAIRTICAPPPCFCCGRYHEFNLTFEDVRRHLIRERAQQLIDRLNSLHRSCPYMRIDSGVYVAFVDLVSRLDRELRDLIGCRYADLPRVSFADQPPNSPALRRLP